MKALTGSIAKTVDTVSVRQLHVAICLAALAACLFGTITVAHAAFTNGGFESGSNNQPPPGWTVTPYLNPSTGITVQTPQTRAGLNLQTGGTPLTYTLTSASGPGTQVDPNLGASASLRWPLYGNSVAVVNWQGTSRNVNSMKQTATMGTEYRDPIDGKIHVRFALAPVIQDPGHVDAEQPYVFVQLVNQSKGNAVFYSRLISTNSPGEGWKSYGTGTATYKYTDWRAYDIAPGDALLEVGDLVELEVIAASCALGSHKAYAYVDSAGSVLPGLFVSGSGPERANQNTDITYTFRYQNGGTSTAAGVVVEENIPANTVFASVNAPGLTCTTPAIGAAGLVSCVVETLPAGASGEIKITVHINNGTAGTTVSNGNYSIRGTGVAPLLGSLVETYITAGVLYSDLAVNVTDNRTSVEWGQGTSYSITVTNSGPNAASGATVTDTLPSELTGATWTCSASGGSSCGASGNGSIHDTVNIAAGGQLVYTLNAYVIEGTGGGTLRNVVSVAPSIGMLDPVFSNDAAVDSDVIIARYAVMYDANGAENGGVPVNGGYYPPGGSVSVAANSGNLTRTGYTFADWNTAADGSGIAYAAGSSFTMGTANITLYARWLPATASLTVTISGTGSVTSNNGIGINDTCDGGTCLPVTFNYNDTVTLTATGANSSFSGWSGDYISNSNPGGITMNGDKSVTASFTADPAKVRIDGDPTPYYVIGTALAVPPGPATIRVQGASDFVENITMTIPVAILLKGGYSDAEFSSQSSYSTISGWLKIQAGKLTAERVRIKSP